jgi:hypothetical protein
VNAWSRPPALVKVAAQGRVRHAAHSMLETSPSPPNVPYWARYRSSRVTEDDRAIAREVIRMQMALEDQNAPSSSLSVQTELEWVAICTAMLTGDRAAKIAAHRRAAAGARLVTKLTPPSARSLWGSPDHFFEHLARFDEQLAREDAERELRRAERLAANASATVVPTVDVIRRRPR